MENQEFTPAPNNHLAKSILTLIFCCLPLGIIALMHSTKVRELWAQGLKQQAQQEADAANKWGNIAIGCGIAFYVIYIIIVVATGVAAAYL